MNLNFGVYLKKDLPKIIDGAYVINLDEYKLIWTHWIASYVDSNNATYFDSITFEYIPKEIKKFRGSKNITIGVYRIQAYDSIMCWYFCFGLLFLS